MKVELSDIANNINGRTSNMIVDSKISNDAINRIIFLLILPFFISTINQIIQDISRSKISLLSYGSSYGWRCLDRPPEIQVFR